jgi:hypothetical protein
MTAMASADGGDPPAAAEKNDEAGRRDSKSKTTQAPSQVPTEAEALEFFETVSTALDADDVSSVNALFDLDAMFNAATVGFGESAEIRKARSDFMSSIKSAIAMGRGYFASIAKKIQNGGSYSCLRSHVVDGKRRLLVRVLEPGALREYHDLVLSRRGENKVVIVDAYLMRSGELMSQATRRAFLPYAKHVFPKIVDGSNGLEREFFNHAEKLRVLERAMRERRFSEAAATFESLPEAMRHDRALQLMYVKASAELGEEKFVPALAELRKRYPEYPSVDLISIDWYVFKKDYPPALPAIDRLDSALGGDAHLKILKAGIYVEQKELVAARKLADAAIAEEPTLLEAHWALVSISLAKKDFRETASHLTRIADTFEIEFADLTEIEEYAEFVKSPEYAEWVKTHPPAKDE